MQDQAERAEHVRGRPIEARENAVHARAEAAKVRRASHNLRERRLARGHEQLGGGPIKVVRELLVGIRAAALGIAQWSDAIRMLASRFEGAARGPQARSSKLGVDAIVEPCGERSDRS